MKSTQETQEEIRRNAERYKSLFQFHPDVVCELDPSGKILDINSSVERLTGYGIEESISRSFRGLIVPEDKQLVSEYFDKAVKGTSQIFEMSSFHKTGRIIHWRVTYVPIITCEEIIGLYAICRDITEQKQIETSLVESEERFRRLVEFSPNAISIQQDGTLTYINREGIKLIGATDEEEVIGRTIFDFLHPDHVKDAIRQVRKIRRNHHFGQEGYKLCRLNGEVVYVDLAGVVDPKTDSNIFIFKDITERKLAEQALIESEKLYNQLHTSLDRFFKDVFGVTKVSQLEQRLIEEVQSILDTRLVSMIQIDIHQQASIQRGDRLNSSITEDLVQRYADASMCEIYPHNDGIFIKLGEHEGKHYLLYIQPSNPSSLDPKAQIWLKTISRFVHVLYENLHTIEDLTWEIEEIFRGKEAPAWLLRLLFNIAENERKRLALDLHDSALQEQIIWCRKIEDLIDHPECTEEIRKKLDITRNGLLDVIHQIRLTCNELRPPFLKQMGIVEVLKGLFKDVQLRSDFVIRFNVDEFDNHELNEEQITGLYRIVQELLANAAKHSDATHLDFKLTNSEEKVNLFYKDNGKGMDLAQIRKESKSIGIYGIHERVRSLEGRVTFYSSPNEGFELFIIVPLNSSSKLHIAYYPNLIIA